MNKENIKHALIHRKIKDVSNPERLAEALGSVGIEVCSDHPYYMISEAGTAIEVEKCVFDNLALDEISAQSLYKNLAEKDVYTQGEILTAVKNGKRFTFIFLEELEDGTLLGLGQYSGGLAEEPMRYTKRLCRKASQDEIAIFSAICNDHGINIEFVDGLVDIFKLRLYGQVYYSAKCDFHINRIVIGECKEEHSDEDDYNEQIGNYFRTEDECAKAIERSFKPKAKVKTKPANKE